MRSFNLIERRDGRVILDDRKPAEGEEVIQKIKADTWMQARAQIADIAFFHDIGNGCFKEPRTGALEQNRYVQEKERLWKDHVARVIKSLVDIESPQSSAQKSRMSGRGKAIGQYA